MDWQTFWQVICLMILGTILSVIIINACKGSPKKTEGEK